MYTTNHGFNVKIHKTLRYFGIKADQKVDQSVCTKTFHVFCKHHDTQKSRALSCLAAYIFCSDECVNGGDLPRAMRLAQLNLL